MVGVLGEAQTTVGEREQLRRAVVCGWRHGETLLCPWAARRGLVDPVHAQVQVGVEERFDPTVRVLGRQYVPVSAGGGHGGVADPLPGTVPAARRQLWRVVQMQNVRAERVVPVGEDEELVAAPIAVGELVPGGGARRGQRVARPARVARGQGGRRCRLDPRGPDGAWAAETATGARVDPGGEVGGQRRQQCQSGDREQFPGTMRPDLVLMRGVRSAAGHRLPRSVATTGHRQRIGQRAEPSGRDSAVYGRPVAGSGSCTWPPTNSPAHRPHRRVCQPVQRWSPAPSIVLPAHQNVDHRIGKLPHRSIRRSACRCCRWTWLPTIVGQAAVEIPISRQTDIFAWTHRVPPCCGRCGGLWQRGLEVEC